jgi:hypothetical protein
MVHKHRVHTVAVVPAVVGYTGVTGYLAVADVFNAAVYPAFAGFLFIAGVPAVACLLASLLLHELLLLFAFLLLL